MMKVLAIVLLAAAAAQGGVIPERVDPIIFYPEALKNLGLDKFVPSAIGKSDRIVGGTEVEPHSIPWQCALLVGVGSFCGCSIISNDWILTAAHCTDRHNNFEVIYGAHRWQLESEPGQVRRVVNGPAIVHEDWSRLTLAGDISVLQVPSPVEFNAQIQAIRLQPSSNPEMHVDATLTVTGWGLTQDNGAVSSVLNTVDVVGITTDRCRSTYGNIITDKHLCTSTTGGHGTCSGDSGGPLTTADKSYQVGIVSFGSSQGCQLEYDVGFTRVSAYADWVTANTGIANTA